MDSSDLGGKAGKYRMDQKKIDRINELAKKARTPEGLTPEETQERAALRREYIDTVVGNLARELDNTWVVDENGNKRKLRKRGEEDPAKKNQAATFLNYYLPTTEKLLDSYADFEEAGVSGENLTQAKEKIRRTMDSIMAGFERQLDALYHADAMDVDSDIRVMETMLRRDGGSVEEDFGLGGTAVATQEDL